MYVVAFTGPSDLTAAQCEFVTRYVESMSGVDARWRFVTGGATGVDTLVCEVAAREFPNARHLILAPDAPWSGVVPDGAKVLRVMSAVGVSNVDAYMERNLALAMRALKGRLVAFVRSTRPYRSGEWATIRRARKVGAPTELVLLP